MESLKLERCSYCGRVFSGNRFLTPEEIDGADKNVLDKLILGYCPEAQLEADGESHEEHRVTRDMAIDAGDLSLEGQII